MQAVEKAAELGVQLRDGEPPRGRRVDVTEFIDWAEFIKSPPVPGGDLNGPGEGGALSRGG